MNRNKYRLTFHVIYQTARKYYDFLVVKYSSTDDFLSLEKWKSEVAGEILIKEQNKMIRLKHISILEIKRED